VELPADVGEFGRIDGVWVAGLPSDTAGSINRLPG
jgi:hypothetical protein